MPEEGKEEMPTPEQPKEGGPEKPAEEEIKPNAGRAPWFIQPGDPPIINRGLEQLIKGTERKLPAMHTVDWLQKRWDSINDEFGETEQADLYLNRLETRIEELRNIEEERRQEDERRVERALGKATTEAYRQPDFRKDDLAWQQRWLRQKLFILETREVNFESYGNMPIYGPVMAHYSELLPDVRQGWEARRVLHDFSFFFEQQGVFSESVNQVASSVTNRHLDVLLKLPGVGIALREYEKRAHSNNLRENILVDLDLEEKRAKIAEKARGEEKEEGETEEEWIARGFAAQRIAEHVWRITGRAALWARLLPPQFRAGQGNGVAGSCEVFMARVYNYENWAKNHGALEEMLPYADLHLLDYWSNLSGEFWWKYGVLKEQLNVRGEPTETMFLDSMEDIPFEKLNIKSLPEGSYGAYWGDFNDANNTRAPLLGFLRTPTARTLLEAAGKFSHLGPEYKTAEIKGQKIMEKTSQRAVCERLLKGLIWFRRHLSQRVFKEKNWNSTNIENAVRGIQSNHLITEEQAENILREELGPTAIRGLRKEAAYTDWGEVLAKPIGAFFKALFGGK